MLCLSRLENSIDIVASGEALLDPYRNKHFRNYYADKSSQEYKDTWATWEQHSWTGDQMDEYEEVTKTVWTHPNGAFDIRIQGYNDYVKAVEQFWQPFSVGDLDTKAFRRGLTDAMNAATQKYGLDEQRDLYRS